MYRLGLFFLIAAPAAAQQPVWTATSPMNITREGYAQTLLDDGRVLVTDGVLCRAECPQGTSTEIYDPQTGTWTQAAGMRAARRGIAPSV